MAIAAIVFLALWGWRELGMRASGERVASRDAEIRQLRQENEMLRGQLARLNHELTTGSFFAVSTPPNVAARVLVDPQQRAFIVVLAPQGSYDLALNGQKIAAIDVPRSGQRTMLLEHLPPQADIEEFSLQAR